MPSLADVIKQSQLNVAHISNAGDHSPLGDVPVSDGSAHNPSYTNADLTPDARRHRMGLDTPHAAAPKREDFGRGGHNPTPNGPPEESETDRLLRESKATLSRADPFARMIEGAGNVTAQDAMQKYDTPGAAITKSLGDTASKVYTGVTKIPGDLLMSALSAPATIAKGLASIPEGVEALGDPATYRGMPDAAKQGYDALADDPETATRLFGGMLAAGPAADVAGSAIGKAPAFAGGAISKVGRGVQALGASPVVKGTGWLRKGAAIMHPGLGSLVGAVGPELLEGAGRGIENFGNQVSNIPNSAALEGLKRVGNTDISGAVKNALTPTPTADELAAGSVRATVGAAKNGVASGLSRAQADQRAGWPLGESTAEKSTTPGADVEANRPYAPAVRGVNGNVIQEGRGPSLDGLRRAAPEVYADKLLDQPGSQQFMNDEYTRNKPTADAALGKNDTYDLAEARKVESRVLGASDEEDMGQQLASLSDLDRASRLARMRALGKATRTHSPLAEGF